MDREDNESMKTDKNESPEKSDPKKNGATKEELTEAQLEKAAGGIRGPDARNPKSPFRDVEE
jgi:hypothetical protein